MSKECPIVLNFDILEKRWTVRMVRLLYRKPRKFNELKRSLRGITQGVLSTRLQELEKRHMVSRTVVKKHPVSVSYALTPQAREMFFCWLGN